MKTFVLKKTPGKIRTKSQLLAQGMIASGSNAKPKRVTEVEVILELNPTDCMSAVESLFPGARDYLKIASAQEGFKGEDRSARTKLPEMAVEIFYADEPEPVIRMAIATVKARAVLKVGVSEKAESKLIIKPRGKLTDPELVQLVQLLEADIRVSMEPSQVDIGESEFLSQSGETKEKGKGKGKGKAAKSEAVETVPDGEKPKAAKLGLVYDANAGGGLKGKADAG